MEAFKTSIAPLLIAYGVEGADQIIDFIARTVKATNPNLTGQDLVNEVDGVLKHYLRGKIGFAVDFLWAYPPAKTAIDSEIAKVLAEETLAAPLGLGSV